MSNKDRVIKQDKSRSLLKLSLQIIFILVVFFLLGKILYENWQKLNFSLSQLNYFWLLLSFFLFTLALLGYAVCWQLVLLKLKEHLPLRRAVKLWFWSQVARYIPGSVWQIFGRVYLGREEGISKGKILWSIAVETSFLVISSFLVFALSLPFWSQLEVLAPFLPYFLVGIASLVFLHPYLFNKTTNFFLHRIDREANKGGETFNLSFQDILQILLAYSLVWIIFGIAFYFLMISLQAVALTLIPVFIGLFSISWVLGFLFVIAPGGLGAREGVMVLLLNLYFPLPIAVSMSILSRIWMILSEILILVISSRF